MPGAGIRYQLTEMGIARIQQDMLDTLDPVSERVVRSLGALGGWADDDELALKSQVDKATISACSRKLEQMGLITTVRQ
jgi:DNA-binding MarR family transcriptional regulator